MNVYTVHEPPHPPVAKFERGESLVFVRDGFSWTAALFAPLWMLAHRMWIVLLGYIALQLLLEFTMTSLGVEPQWLGVFAVALQIALGFEASSLQRWTLDHNGWRMLGAVTGSTTTDAERRYFEAWLAEGRQTANTAPQPTTRDGDAVSSQPFRPWWQRLIGARA